MRRVWFLRLAAAAGALLLVVSLLLVSYARWLYGISEGNRALAKNDSAAARQAYETAARQLDRYGFLRSFHPAGYRQLVFNRARALYAGARDEDLARMLEGEAARDPSLAEDSEFHFWMGNVQHRRAVSQKEKPALQAGLQQASESYRRALAAAPDDWDAKYNFELTMRLLENLRKGREGALERARRSQMKLLRESPEKDRNQPRKTPPEKRG